MVDGLPRDARFPGGANGVKFYKRAASNEIRASEDPGAIETPKAMQIRHVQAKLVHMKNRCAARSRRSRLTWT